MKVIETVVLDDSLGDDLRIGKEARVLVQYDELSSGVINVSIDSQDNE